MPLNMTTDKQLRGIKLADVLEKRRLDQAFSRGSRIRSPANGSTRKVSPVFRESYSGRISFNGEINRTGDEHFPKTRLSLSLQIFLQTSNASNALLQPACLPVPRKSFLKR